MLHDNNGASGSNGHKAPGENGNIIQFKIPPAPPVRPSHPPMINLPILTKIMLAIIVACQCLTAMIGWMDQDLLDVIYFHGAFTPASWAGPLPFLWWTPLTVLSFSFLHGGWLHLAVNGIMLAAFGSGVEKWLGARKMLFVFCVSSLIAIFFQFISQPHSMAGVVGISGGISGFFGALLLMMQQQRTLGNARNSIMPFVIVWLAVSVIFGFMGAPDGSPIAWLAHIGGFLGGLLATWHLLGYPRVFGRR